MNHDIAGMISDSDDAVRMISAIAFAVSGLVFFLMIRTSRRSIAELERAIQKMIDLLRTEDETIPDTTYRVRNVYRFLRRWQAFVEFDPDRRRWRAFLLFEPDKRCVLRVRFRRLRSGEFSCVAVDQIIGRA